MKKEYFEGVIESVKRSLRWHLRVDYELLLKKVLSRKGYETTLHGVLSTVHPAWYALELSQNMCE